MSESKNRDRLIKAWLTEIADDIHRALQDDLRVETKSRANDLVTYMDRKIEKELVEKIKEHYPTHKIVSEEGYGDDPTSINMAKDTVWFLDPIDGTLNFVLQNENFAVMLAVYEEGIGQQAYIYDVIKNHLYWSLKGHGVFRNNEKLPQMTDKPLAEGLFASNSMFLSNDQVKLNAEITKRSMGVRTIGSAGIEATELVKGSTLAYVSFGLKPWDLAPGVMMVEENGGVVTHFDGSPINLFKAAPTIMGTPQAQKEIVSLLKK